MGGLDWKKAGVRLLVRWHKLTSKPRGIAVYSTGENWLCSQDTAGLYWLHWCWFVFIVTITCCRLIHAGRGINQISVRCATGFIFLQSWSSL